MGGSGSGGWSPSPSVDRCGTLSFDAQINSPQAAVLSTLTLGDLLDVSLSALPKQSVEVKKLGNVAGVLTGPETPGLIRCLQNGYKFKAEVSSLVGGQCTVKVQPL